MNRRKAELLLVGVTMAWGTSYPLMKNTLQDMAPLNLIALRFGIAFIAAFIIFYRQVFPADRRTLFWSGVLGLLLTAIFTTLLFGMMTTGVSEAAFLAGISVVFVPLVHMVLLRKLPSFRNTLGMVITAAGIWLLSGGESVHLKLGSFLCILCSFLYAFHILLTRWCVERMKAMALGVYQLGFTCAAAAVLSFTFENPVWPQTPRQWVIIWSLGLLCSAFGFLGQTLAQGHTSPERVGFIFTLEPVFTAVLAAIFLHETLPALGYLGGALIVAGVLLSSDE